MEIVMFCIVMLNCFFVLSAQLTDNMGTVVTMHMKGVTHTQGLSCLWPHWFPVVYVWFPLVWFWLCSTWHIP